MNQSISIPKISVIVPVYNVEKYIERCAVSLLEQTFSDIEYIFVDDCSPDNAIDTLKKVIDRYPQKRSSVVIHRLRKNVGQAAARNCGIRLSKGEYIAFVDADDWVDRNIYATLYENIVKEEAQISCCGIERVCNDLHVEYFNNNLELYRTFEDKKEILESILDNTILTCSPCDKLFKSEIIKNNLFLEGMIFEDFDIMPKWLYMAKKIVYTGRPLYFYRTNPISTMSTVTAKRLDEVEASNIRIAFYKSKCPELVTKVKARHIEICMNVLSCTVNAQNCREKRRQLIKQSNQMLTFELFTHVSIQCKIKLLISCCGLYVFDFVVSRLKK